MFFLPLLLLGAGVASIAIAKMPVTSAAMPQRTSVGDVLYGLPYEATRGALTRIVVRLPGEYQQQIRLRYGADSQKLILQGVREALAEVPGVVSVLLVTQDPTEQEMFKVIVRGSPQASTAANGLVTVIASEQVSPTEVQRAEEFRPQFAPLDTGMTADDQAAFEKALFNNGNIRHLRGLAYSFEPTFAVSGSVLRAKADLAERRVHVTPDIAQNLLRAAWEPTAITAEPAKAAQKFMVGYAAPELARDVALDSAAAFIQGDKPDAAAFAVGRFFVKEIPSNSGQQGIFLLDPHVVRQAFPLTGDEGYVSPSALELVQAETKPWVSGVLSSNKVLPRLSDVKNAGKNPQAIRAQAMLVKARRAIDRRRWIEWYRRHP